MGIVPARGTEEMPYRPVNTTSLGDLASNSRRDL
jgi:hypothetical protein